jgi:PPOX class probable F420-dependent enzyme
MELRRCPGGFKILAMTVPLSDLAKRLADEKTFAAISTINPDGSPQSTVVWIKRDGDDVVFSTIRGRRKTKNLERDPRATVTVFDPANPYLYTEIRGTVSLSDVDGRALIDELSNKYKGTPYPQEPDGTVRLVCRLTPSKVLGR